MASEIEQKIIPFSDKVSLVNTAHPDYVNFNYYDAHRAILSFKVSLSAKPEK